MMRELGMGRIQCSSRGRGHLKDLILPLALLVLLQAGGSAGFPWGHHGLVCSPGGPTR